MTRTRKALATAVFLALASAAGAQPQPAAQGPPGPPPGPGGMGPGQGRPALAAVLLAHTGELKLNDQQVTRLAAIARRSSDRRAAMRGMMDSLQDQARGRANAPGEAQGAPPPALRAQMEKIREQEHAELRDALAILTADQQATAFEMAARREPGPGSPAGRGGPPNQRRDGARPGASGDGPPNRRNGPPNREPPARPPAQPGA